MAWENRITALHMDSSGSVGIDARRVNTMTEPSVKRGDIFYADLSPVVGSEQGGTRPVLIHSTVKSAGGPPPVLLRF